MKNKKMLGNCLLTLAALIWGTAFAAQRVGMEKIEPMTFNAARMALAAVAIALVAAALGPGERKNVSLRNPEEEKRYKKNTIFGGIGCGIFLAAASIFQQMGLVYMTAGKAGFITAMYMLFVPIINFLLFKKKNTWLVWLAVFIGITGMYFLCMTEGFYFAYEDTLMCICAVLFSGHILCCDRFVRFGNPIWISMIQFITATVISTIAALIMETPTLEKILSAAVPIVYCGIMSGGVGYTLQIIAQRFTDPTVASLLMSLESVFAVIAGAVFLNERMSFRELLGCIIMFVAILLVQIPLPQKE